MEPIPETSEALDEYLEDSESSLRTVLTDMAAQALRLVPACVGLSLALVKDGLTFTLVATGAEISVIDAAQYLDGGPCVEVADGNAVLGLDIEDLLDEERWSAFARTSAANGVRSTLSLPLVRNDVLIGGINLYAATAGAFQGLHAVLAAALGASAEGAVSDADLGFTTRALARRTPSVMADLRAVDVATGLLAARQGTDVDTARARLIDAAVRAGVTLTQAANVVLGAFQA